MASEGNSRWLQWLPDKATRLYQADILAPCVNRPLSYFLDLLQWF